RWRRAESVAGAIGDKQRKAEAFLNLSRAFIRAQQWEQARRVAEIIGVEELKIEALQEISEGLIKEQEWEEATVVAWTIKLHEKRIKVLQLLGHQLEASKAYESLLHLVQLSWLQATTRTEALTFLPFANGLISLNPEIGTTFHEALTWTERFLAGE